MRLDELANKQKTTKKAEKKAVTARSKKKTTAKQAASSAVRKATKKTAKKAAKKVLKKAPAKKTTKKVVAKKAAKKVLKKAPAKKTTKKVVAKKAAKKVLKKAPAKKTTKKVVAKKAAKKVLKKAPAKKTTKKVVAKKVAKKAAKKILKKAPVKKTTKKVVAKEVAKKAAKKILKKAPAKKTTKKVVAKEVAKKTTKAEERISDAAAPDPARPPRGLAHPAEPPAQPSRIGLGHPALLPAPCPSPSPSPSPESPPARRLRVVAVVLNPFLNDTRVLKSCRSLLAAGYDVHVIAVLKAGLAPFEDFDGLKVHRIRLNSTAALRLPGVLLSRRPAALRRRLRLNVPADVEVRSEPSSRRRFTRIMPIQLWKLTQKSIRVMVPIVHALKWSAMRIGRLASHLFQACLWFAQACLGLAMLIFRTLCRPISGFNTAFRRFLIWVAPSQQGHIGKNIGLAMRDRAMRDRAMRDRAMRIFGSLQRLVIDIGRLPSDLFLVCLSFAQACLRFAMLEFDALRQLMSRIKPAYRRFVITRVKPAFKRFVVRVAPSQLRIIGMNIDLAEAIVALEPDIVHCHDLNTLVAGRITSKVCSVPIVYDSHELFLERNLSGRSRFIDRLHWGPIERLLIGRCAGVSTVAEGICRHLEKQYRLAEVVLIRNVQPLESPPLRSRLLSEELEITPDRPVLLYAGAILRNRGIERMIEAASIGGEHLAWVVMGYAQDAAYLDSLKQHARDLGVLGRTIYFRDAVKPNEVVRYCASADLSIVPTQKICLSYEFEASNKIFHSVMARVPIAMSNHIEKRLLVDRYGIGALFDETDPQSIVETVQSLLDDRRAYEAACEACGRAAGELNWENEEKKLLSMFNGVASDLRNGQTKQSAGERWPH